MLLKDVLGLQRETGVFPDMGRDEYLSSPGLNASSLVSGWMPDGDIDVCRIRAAYETRKEFSTAKQDQIDRGTLGHMMLLEPERVATDVAIWTGKQRRGSDWTSFCDANAGRLIIRKEDFLSVEKCCRTVIGALSRHHPHILELLSEGEREVAIFSEDFGMATRGQLDWINTRAGSQAIVDLKFSETDMSSRMLDQNIRRFQYDTRMACYRQWLTRESGKSVDRVVTLNIGMVEPYAVVVKDFPEPALEHGWEKAQRLMQATRDAIEADCWPLYVREDEYIPPHWETDEEQIDMASVEELEL